MEHRNTAVPGPSSSSSSGMNSAIPKIVVKREAVYTTQSSSSIHSSSSSSSSIKIQQPPMKKFKPDPSLSSSSLSVKPKDEEEDDEEDDEEEDEEEPGPGKAGPISAEPNEDANREQDRFLPVANIARLMKKVLPGNAKVAKDAKEVIQGCVSEFISFITSEASDKCQVERRKTISGDDLLWAMSTLGFEKYIEPLRVYLSKFREAVKQEKPEKVISEKKANKLKDKKFLKLTGTKPPEIRKPDAPSFTPFNTLQPDTSAQYYTKVPKVPVAQVPTMPPSVPKGV